MITKLFDHVELELSQRVVLIGPNNAGKTSALQALALWNNGVRRWIEKRGTEHIPKERAGVTLNRRDLVTVPVPTANQLWRGLRTQESSRGGDNRKIFIEITVEGIHAGQRWVSGFEFYYANEESLYCRPLRQPDGNRMEVPTQAVQQPVSYLAPMSGLAPTELRLDIGAINVLLGEGRTAELLRNLCYQVLISESGEEKWHNITQVMKSLFGIVLEPPRYISERGEIIMSYRNREKTLLDISTGGRGQQQTLLLLAYLAANPNTVMLLDEPDAHLEILRQRQIYQVLTDTAARTGSQIIAASHSEVILNEAADRDVVIAFVGQPHRIDDRGSQVLKALKEIGFEQYYQAEETGWVLYLDGSTDLAMLRAFADRLQHPARAALDRPFVHYVANQPSQARNHFRGLREAKPDLAGVAIYDRLPQLPSEPDLTHSMWRRRELENYLCQRETLLRFARAQAGEQLGDLFKRVWETEMTRAMDEVESALAVLEKPSPWGADIKASDEFLDPVFRKFYTSLDLAPLIRKTDFHILVPCVPHSAIDPEVTEKLDLIAEVAERARPRRT